MARYTGAKHKLCRREGIALCGLPKCPVLRKNAPPPGQHGQKGRRKLSEYGVQLREKQKVKRMYGLLERHLDNVVYRLNLARSRAQARQLVSHGHISVNGKKMTIPSYNVKIGDVIALSAQTANLDFIKKLTEETKETKLPSWLRKKATVGKIEAMPKRDELEADINEKLIVEYYSR